MDVTTLRSRARTTARAAVATTAAALAVTLGPASTAAAAPPEVVEVDRTFVNGPLSQACGFPVEQHLWGSFATTRHGSRTITQYRFRSTLTANGVVVDSRSFGPTIEEDAGDGTLIITQLGVTMRNVPGDGTIGPFAGRSVVRAGLDDGSEVVVAESGLRRDVTELCAALAG